MKLFLEGSNRLVECCTNYRDSFFSSLSSSSSSWNVISFRKLPVLEVFDSLSRYLSVSSKGNHFNHEKNLVEQYSIHTYKYYASRRIDTQIFVREKSQSNGSISFLTHPRRSNIFSSSGNCEATFFVRLLASDDSCIV